MKVCVEKIKSDKMVSCSTDFGKLNVKWDGKLPNQGDIYQVEFDINRTLSWGKEILLANIPDHTIYMEDDLVILVGTLESIDEDGYAILRIGQSIVPFIAEGVAFEIGATIRVSINTIIATEVHY